MSISPSPFPAAPLSSGLTNAACWSPTSHLLASTSRQSPSWLMDILQAQTMCNTSGYPVEEISFQTRAAIRKSAESLLRYLHVSDAQRQALEDIYCNSEQTVLNFDDSNQDKARDKLAELGSDRVGREDLSSRWSFTIAMQSTSMSKIESFARKIPHTPSLNARRVFISFLIPTLAALYTLRYWNVKTATYSEYPASLSIMKSAASLAILQLVKGATLTAIQRTNQEMISKKQYRGLRGDQSKANFHYIILSSDNITLYRKHALLYGIDIRLAPQYNIDNWINTPLGSLPTKIQAQIREAIFYYQAQAERGDQIKVCIATLEMDKAVMNERILMFIAMGIDENRKGLPIAIFLFSAPLGAQATHANYDREILYELLKSWKDHLEKKFSTAFTPTCIITDTDVCKQNALICLWANIILLLCKFHVTQCWTNSRKAKVTGKQEDVIKADIVKRLKSLEQRLLEMVKHEDAMLLIHQEQVYFRTLQTQKPGNKTIKGALLHIMYLLDNWMLEATWKSWSAYGRKQAAAVLAVEPEDVLTTTNHLERFNGILKGKEIGAWLHSGRCLCFNRRGYQDWLGARFREAAGGGDVFEMKKALQEERRARREAEKRYCYWEPDSLRDNGTKAILTSHAFRNTIRLGEDGNLIQGFCRSSSGDLIYTVELRRIGTGSCSCMEFSSRGGACKHLHALRHVAFFYLRQQNQAPFFFPSSEVEAMGAKRLASSAAVETVEDETDNIDNTDWTALQQAAADDTTLGDELDEKEGTASIGVEVVEDEDSGGDVGFTAEDQQEAINGQVTNSIKYHIASASKPLQGIKNLVSELAFLPQDETIEEFQDLIQDISNSFHALRLQHSPPSPTQTCTASNASSPSNSPPRQTTSMPTTPERGPALGYPTAW
ncbi:hypothetical protein D9758_003847 [Tetrapyrgos nigripes]|uniref:SWIM-type domain-containing protein n=1 Tax=Tetrapyrgos nigripes TaxID=182062 RepID=A0A8H5GL97_9AGAR|nr:hypothetical protein D9758_003847 [Tetrapyrgos nigripes]